MHPGTLGEYRLERELGRGAVGVVWLARDGLGREVALKVVEAIDATDQLRFQREVEALGAVRHPGVVGVHASGRSPTGQCWVACELVPGRDLRRLVAEEGPLSPAEAARVVRDLADALAAVHRAGLVHRDLKPENAILRPDRRPVLIDFGLVRPHEVDRLTRTGEVLGTPAYMSPEQAKGERGDARSDVWALGGTLGFLLVGRAPFRGTSLIDTLRRVIEGQSEWPVPLAADCPPELEAIVRKAMAPDPARRFPDAGAFRDALDAVLRGETARRGRGPWLRLGAALSLAVGAAALLLRPESGPKPEAPAAPAAAPPSSASPAAPAPVSMSWPDRLVLHPGVPTETSLAARFLGRWVLITNIEVPLLQEIPAERGATSILRAEPWHGCAMGAEDQAGETFALIHVREGVWHVEWRELSPSPKEGALLAEWAVAIGASETVNDLELIRLDPDHALIGIATVTAPGEGRVRWIELARGAPPVAREVTTGTVVWELEFAHDGRTLWGAAGDNSEASGALLRLTPGPGAGLEVVRRSESAHANVRGVAVDPELGVLVGDGSLDVILYAPGVEEPQLIATAFTEGGLRPGPRLRGVGFVQRGRAGETLLLVGTTGEGGGGSAGELVAWRPGATLERLFRWPVALRWHALDVSRDRRCLLLSGRGGVELLSVDGLTGRR